MREEGELQCPIEIHKAGKSEMGTYFKLVNIVIKYFIQGVVKIETNPILLIGIGYFALPVVASRHHC